MLVQSSVARTVMHGRRAVSIGVDMGSDLWVATVVECDTGKERCHRFTGEQYDLKCYRMIKGYTDKV
jgi:hypothetical protein